VRRHGGVAFESVRQGFGKTVALKDVSCSSATASSGPAWAIGLRQDDAAPLLPASSGSTGHRPIGDRDVSDLPPRDRHIAWVFQSYVVFRT